MTLPGEHNGRGLFGCSYISIAPCGTLEENATSSPVMETVRLMCTDSSCIIIKDPLLLRHVLLVIEDLLIFLLAIDIVARQCGP